MKKIFAICVFFFVSESFSQNEIKFFSSIDSLSINEVSISIDNSFQIIVKDGKFKADNTSLNSILSIKSSGYKDTIISLKEALISKNIYLQPLVYQLPEIKKIQKKEAIEKPGFYEKIPLDLQAKYSTYSISDLLKIHSTFEVKDYGGSSSLKTLSARGMSSENTLILFNEARLNNFYNSSFDFSKLSTLSVKTIETQKGGYSDGYFTPGGIIKINTGNFTDSFDLFFKTSFDNNNVASSAIRISDKLIEAYDYSLKYSMLVDISYGKNNFEYFFEGKRKRRQGSDLKKKLFVADILWTIDNLSIKYYGSYNNYNISIPGYVVSNFELQTGARDINRSFLNIININFGIDLQNYVILTLNSSNSTLLIDDPNNYFNYQNNQKKSYLDDYGVSLKFHNAIRGFLEFDYGFMTNYAALKNKNDFLFAINPRRYFEKLERTFYLSNNLRIDLSKLYIKEVKIFSSLSYTHGKEKGIESQNPDLLSRGIGATIQPDLNFDLLFKFYKAKSGRFPNFYERYYQNINSSSYILKPEKYDWTEAGIFLNFGDANIFEFAANYFSIFSKDKIVWIPVRFTIQSPRNFAKVLSRGAEVSASQSIFENSLKLGLKYSFIKALNKLKLAANDNSYNKQIPYIPRHKISAFFSLNYRSFFGGISFLFNSRRYLTRDNDIFSSLDPFLATDCSFGYEYIFKSIKLIPSINAYNLFDSKYEIIKSYPMPLRTIIINLTMEVL